MGGTGYIGRHISKASLAVERPRILTIGGTGYIGRQISKASIALGHPTFLLVRESTASNPEKAKLLESFKASGATILHVSGLSACVSVQISLICTCSFLVITSFGPFLYWW